MIDTDTSILRLAGQHLGVVTRAQLLGLGLSPKQIQDRRRRGLLRAIARGLYVVEGWPSTYEREVLVVERRHPRAVAASGTAARLWPMATLTSAGLEFLSTSSRPPQYRGVIIRSTVLLPDADIVVRPDGIVLTSPARTIFDLANRLDPKALAPIIERAVVSRLLTLTGAELVIDRLDTVGHRGAGELRILLRQLRAGGRFAMTDFERTVFALIENAGLPLPVRQHPLRSIDGRKINVDLAYPELKIAIEADSRSWHSTEDDFQRDIDRDRVYAELGWCKVPVSKRDSDERPQDFLRVLRRVLTARLAGHAA
jgi:very-short-patch-repair endonuclease